MLHHFKNPGVSILPGFFVETSRVLGLSLFALLFTSFHIF